MANSFKMMKGFMPVLIAAATLASCSEETPVNPGNNNIQVPTAYSFDSRFKPGTSSVAYGGQVVRNLLIQDLTTTINNLAKAGATAITVDDLLKYYEHKDASNMTTLIQISGTQVLEPQYNKISTGKDLKGKISSEAVIGSGKTADQLLREWFQIIADNSQDPTKLGTPAVLMDASGRHLGEMVNKLLMGSIAYYQATGVYLKDVLTANNGAAVATTGGTTEPFSQMEHSWDEAFGYFGASRDFARYTDAKLAGPIADYTFDSNGDGKIDLSSEFNYSIARYAAKRDVGATGVDFTKDIFDAFLKGRTAIVNQGTADEISAQRKIVVEGWEKVWAANVIHYLNEVKTHMTKIGTAEEKRADLDKVWSEMKGFAMGLQYNPFKLISSGDLSQLHTLLGDAPVHAAPGSSEYTAYVEALNSAKGMLKLAYGFSEANVNSW